MRPQINRTSIIEVSADLDVWVALRNLLDRGVERATVRALGLEDLRTMLVREYIAKEDWQFTQGARLKHDEVVFPAESESKESP